MTIKKLNDKHLELIRNPKECRLIGESHTKISIQFAIEILESDALQDCRASAWGEDIYYKIQELKQYLDEKI